MDRQRDMRHIEVYKVWKERVLKRQGIDEGDGPEDRQIGSSKQICMATGKRFVVFISWPGTLHPLPLIPPAVSDHVKEIVAAEPELEPCGAVPYSLRLRLNFVESELISMMMFWKKRKTCGVNLRRVLYIHV